MHPKVSVIIPVYNVELYLHECMNSIVNQTLKEIEIICVDDGSTDNSLAILNEYAEKDDRIIILQQENQGAGVARNSGLDIAKGEYLSFLDPDDFFELNMLEISYHKASETDVDILAFGCQTYNENTKEFSEKVGGIPNGIRYENLPDKLIFCYKDMETKGYDTFVAAAWNKLYKKSFITENKIFFQPLFRVNDKYFTTIATLTAKKITTIQNSLMCYRIGMKTNSQSTLDKFPLCFYLSELATRDKLKIMNIYNEVEKGFLKSNLSSTIHSLNGVKTYNGFKKIFEHISHNYENDFSIIKNEEYFINDENKYFNEIYQDYRLILENSVDEYLELKKKYFIDQDNNSIKISVIIPVYNVEKYLRECLDSVINQTLEHIEIICINDCSTDNSLNILKEYAKKDNRIIILEQKNQGAGIARNNGLNIAKGEYIAFIDPDDYYLDLEILNELYKVALYSNYKIIGGSLAVLQKNQLKTKFLNWDEKKNHVFTKTEKIQYRNYQNDYYFQKFIYNRNFLISNNIKFPKYRRYEDPPFLVLAMVIAKEFYVIPKISYVYRTSNKEPVVDNEILLDLLNGILYVIQLSLKHELFDLFNITISRFNVFYVKYFDFYNLDIVKIKCQINQILASNNSLINFDLIDNGLKKDILLSSNQPNKFIQKHGKGIVRKE